MVHSESLIPIIILPSLDTSKTPFLLWKPVPLSLCCPASHATLLFLIPVVKRSSPKTLKSQHSWHLTTETLKRGLMNPFRKFPGIAEFSPYFLQGSHVYS